MDNNFDNFKPESSSSSILKKVIGSVGRLPGVMGSKEELNLLGQLGIYMDRLALEHELNLLERQGVSSQYTKEIEELILKIEQLSSIDWSKIIFDPVIISQPSIHPRLSN